MPSEFDRSGSFSFDLQASDPEEIDLFIRWFGEEGRLRRKAAYGIGLADLNRNIDPEITAQLEHHCRMALEACDAGRIEHARVCIHDADKRYLVLREACLRQLILGSRTKHQEAGRKGVSGRLARTNQRRQRARALFDELYPVYGYTRTIRMIMTRLDIPRSTLGDWFRRKFPAE